MNEKQRKIKIQGWDIDITEVYAISPIEEIEGKLFFNIKFLNRDEIDFWYSADLFNNNLDEAEKDREYILTRWKGLCSNK